MRLAEVYIIAATEVVLWKKWGGNEVFFAPFPVIFGIVATKPLRIKNWLTPVRLSPFSTFNFQLKWHHNAVISTGAREEWARGVEKSAHQRRQFGNLAELFGRLSPIVGNLAELFGRLSPMVGNLVELFGRLSPMVGNLAGTSDWLA